MRIPSVGIDPFTVFNPNELRAGDIIRVRRYTSAGRRSGISYLIRRAIGSWASHDALAVIVNGNTFVGDAVSPRARPVPICELAREIVDGEVEVRVCRPYNAIATQGQWAAAWWMTHVNGAWYDWGAYPRLLLKALVGDRCPWPVGWEWAWYCSEGVRDAWRHVTGRDYWGKASPTPRTTENRVRSEHLQDVTGVVAWPDWIWPSVDTKLAIRKRPSA